jgi:hypothetical protein
LDEKNKHECNEVHEDASLELLIKDNAQAEFFVRQKNNQSAANNMKFLVIFAGIFLIIISTCFFVGNVNKNTQSSQKNSLKGDIIRKEPSGISNGEPLKGDVRITNSTNIQLQQDITDEIVEFIDVYYRSLGTLEERDLTAFYDLKDKKSEENALINQTSLSYLVSARKAQPNDLTFKEYSCQLNITEINHLDNGDIEVKLEESNEINFSFISDVDSISSGISNAFVFSQINGAWKMVYHIRSEDIYTIIEDEYLLWTNYGENAGSDNGRGILNEIKAVLLAEAVENVNIRKSELAKYISDKSDYDRPKVAWDKPYNRDTAIEYAMEWVSPSGIVRNNQWQTYDDLGGNCNNYISQCIYAGGIPMDLYGDEEVQWKWYGDSINGWETAHGRVASWAGVEEFYYYCLYNTGYGMAASVDENLCSGQKADILQYGTGDIWNHSVIITNIVKDGKGNPVDYLVNSNSTDRINYPASAYPFSRQRLIKIYGWNEN